MIVLVLAVAGLLGIVWMLATADNGVQAQQSPRPTPAQQGSPFIALSIDTGNGRQQIAVIDTQSRALSVYHIDNASGAITLKSVRNIAADLLLDDFNTESPLPREIRAMLTK
jgi:hypothetical protein